MAASVPSVDIRRPPSELSALVEWFDAVSYRLVLLEEYPLDEVQGAVDRFTAALAGHLARSVPSPGRLRRGSRPGPSPGDAPLEREHERFAVSIEQLRWLLGVLEREDHGGHRQALGQYGRILTESLRHHLVEESMGGTDRPVPPFPSNAPGKRK